MKKQFLAKLLVLAMVLSMIPGTMLVAAAATGGNDGSEKPYIVVDDTKIEDLEISDVVATEPTVTVNADDITIEDGSAKIKVTVTNGVAKLKLDSKAVASLATAVKSGSITLELDDAGATELTVTLPAKAVTALAKETGADLNIKSTVAEISIPNNVLASAMGKTGNVSINATHSDSTIGFSIATTGGKSLKNVKGIKVEF